jgi:D-sedoheptulose 7-phosphate isomerase
MLNFENIGDRFTQVVHTKEWDELQEKYNNCDDIYVLGHGGNLAVADHAAVDMTRLSNGTKNAICPGSGVVATSYINDSSFEQWMVNWLIARTSTRTASQMNRSLVLGISSSGNSIDILKALQWAQANGMQVAMITSRDITVEVDELTKVVLGANYYHTAEVLTLLLTYQLTHGSGNVCPPIGQNNPDELKKLNWKGGKIREHSYPDEQINVGIDFDKVIHKSFTRLYSYCLYLQGKA